jgi:hypothetical protein
LGVRDATGDARPPAKGEIPNVLPDSTGSTPSRDNVTTEICGVSATNTAQMYHLYNRGQQRRVESSFRLVAVPGKRGVYKMIDAQSRAFGLRTVSSTDGGRFQWLTDRNALHQQFKVISTVQPKVFETRSLILEVDPDDFGRINRSSAGWPLNGYNYLFICT